MQRLPGTLLCIGLWLLIGTVLLGWIALPALMHSQISQSVRLTNGTDVWAAWKDIPFPIYLKVYLFNVTNPNEVEVGENPILQELGPFVYEEHREKKEIRSFPKNDTVQYRQFIWYTFKPEMSNGTEDDLITIINIPFVAVSQELGNLPRWLRVMVQGYLRQFKQTLFIKHTVKDLMFGGIYQPMIHEIQELTGEEALPNATFGLFYGRNGTDEGIVEINTGIRDISRIGATVTWQGKPQLDFWNGTTCNMLNGTDGTIFPPFTTRKTNLQIFAPELCRSIYLVYKEDIHVNGIPGYRFSVPKEMMQHFSKNPSNKCFCKESSEELCLQGDGAYPLKSCRKGAPLAISTAHFLDGDEAYAKKVGLVPNRDRHQVVIDLEPNTGIVLHANKRIQVNVDVKKLSYVNSFKNIEDMLLPVFWIDETATIDHEHTEKIRTELVSRMQIIFTVLWIIIAIGSVLISSSAAVFCARIRRKPAFT